MSEKQNTCCKERPENTLSVDDFPSSKEDSFPSLLLPECHTAGMRLLGGRDSVAMTPEALCPGRAPTLTGKSKQLPSESALHIKWPKYWSISFGISPSNEYSGLISFRIDWFDLLAVQVTLKSLLQHHSSKASILRCSTSFTVQLLHPYVTREKTIALTI